MKGIWLDPLSHMMCVNLGHGMTQPILLLAVLAFFVTISPLIHWTLCLSSSTCLLVKMLAPQPAITMLPTDIRRPMCCVHGWMLTVVDIQKVYMSVHVTALLPLCLAARVDDVIAVVYGL